MVRRLVAVSLATLFLSLTAGIAAPSAEACPKSKRCVCKKRAVTKRPVKKRSIARRAPAPRVIYRDRYIYQSPQVIIIREQCPPPRYVEIVEEWEVTEYVPPRRKPRHYGHRDRPRHTECEDDYRDIPCPRHDRFGCFHYP